MEIFYYISIPVLFLIVSIFIIICVKYHKGIETNQDIFEPSCCDTVLLSEQCAENPEGNSGQNIGNVGDITVNLNSDFLSRECGSYDT